MSVPPDRFRRFQIAALALAMTLGGACAAPSRGAGDTGGAGITGGAGTGGVGAAGGAGLGGARGGFGGNVAAGSAGTVGQAGTSGAGGAGAGGTGAPNGGAGGVGARGGNGTAGAGGGPALVIPGTGHCAAPSGANLADAQNAYAKWKSDLVVSDGARGFLRVRRPNSSGAQVDSTVSEGIGYGMLLAVYANDQKHLRQLWQYEQQFPDNHGLMNWYISADGTMPLGTGAATDGDEDMAFALSWPTSAGAVRAASRTPTWPPPRRRSGSSGNRRSIPTTATCSPRATSPTDRSSTSRTSRRPITASSVRRPTPTSNWKKVIDESYTVISATLNAQNGNAQNGLVPAWSTPAGVPMTPPGTSMPLYHQLDSCRTPFRLGEDYCWNAEPRALTYLQKITGFYSGVGVANMVDGYDLNGTPHPQFVTAGGPRAASFVGPAGVGAMATGTTYTQLRDDAYASVATLTELAGSTYYQESWTALSLQMMTGILYDLGQP